MRFPTKWCYFKKCHFLCERAANSKHQTMKGIAAQSDLRPFARKFSKTDFFLQILPMKDDELVMSEM